MKTIFIIVDLGISIRNILRTDVFACLRKRKDLRIVIFSVIVDEEFKEEFASENVFIEPLSEVGSNMAVKLIQSLKKELWAEACDIFTYQNRRKRKNRRLTKRLIIEPLKSLHREEKIKVLFDYLNKVEEKFSPRSGHELFERYHPDLVFYTSIYTKYLSLAIGAKQRKVKTISFMQSWDNPTSKGPFPVVPDRVIVWNEILKKELLTYHNFPSEQIYVSGVPQFDLYLDRDKFLSREEFFRKWNLDPERRLITYTTGSSNMLPEEYKVVEQLVRAVHEGRLIFPAQLLLRPHPKDRFEYETHFKEYPPAAIQRPGPLARTKDRWNPKREDMYGLAELMLYSDVVVNVASTITIDAVCFDTPVVNVAFDGYEKLDYMQSCRRYYDYDHYKNILRAKGVKVSGNLQELIDAVNSYLENPDLDKVGRKRIRDEQCWRLDGKSGERIASCILEYLEENGR
jgi:hypothetical protein